MRSLRIQSWGLVFAEIIILTEICGGPHIFAQTATGNFQGVPCQYPDLPTPTPTPTPVPTPTPTPTPNPGVPVPIGVLPYAGINISPPGDPIGPVTLDWGLVPASEDGPAFEDETIFSPKVYATKITNSGKVLLEYDSGGPNSPAGFVWANGVFEEIGPAAGWFGHPSQPPAPGYYTRYIYDTVNGRSSSIGDMNDAGTIIGYTNNDAPKAAGTAGPLFWTLDPNLPAGATLWPQNMGVSTDKNMPPPLYQFPMFIDDNGRVCGMLNSEDTTNQLVWSGVSSQPSVSATDYSTPLAISTGGKHMLSWSNVELLDGKALGFDYINFGPNGAPTNAQPVGINESGRYLPGGSAYAVTGSNGQLVYDKTGKLLNVTQLPSPVYADGSGMPQPISATQLPVGSALAINNNFDILVQRTPNSWSIFTWTATGEPTPILPAGPGSYSDNLLSFTLPAGWNMASLGTAFNNPATTDTTFTTPSVGTTMNDSRMLIGTITNGTITVPAVFIPCTLLVDTNRDGLIDRNDVGATTATAPFRFWINDGIDGNSPIPNESTVQDSLDPLDSNGNWLPTNSQAGAVTGVPGVVTCTRDLQNFARLWMSIGGLSQAITSGNITVGLEWHSNTGDATNGWGANDGAPAINIYEAAPKHGTTVNTGGTDYLTDYNVDPTQETANDQWTGTNPVTGDKFGVALGTIAKGQTFYFPARTFNGMTSTNALTYFLFEGAARGTGRLVITFNTGTTGNYTKIGESGGVYMDLKDIKELYERYTVGDGPTPGVNAGGGGTPAAAAVISGDRLPPGVPSGLTYASTTSGLSVPTDTNGNKYILFVHGWNMPPWEKDAFAETMLKRLYWQGYKGKFGTFQWPTTYSSSSIDTINKLQEISSYDDGEFTAWQSALPLEKLLVALHSPNAYGNNVYLLAHSMGNVVAGEALRIAGQSGAGQLVNSYVASQAAVPANCYDPAMLVSDPLSYSTDRTVSGATISGGSYGPDTPEIYSSWLASASAAVPTKSNFFNVNDYALGYWQLDQVLKPDIRGYVYYYANDDLTTVQDLFQKSSYPDLPTAQSFIKLHPLNPNNIVSGGVTVVTVPLQLGDATNVHGRYEIMAYAAEPRSLALGAVSDAAANGVFAVSQNLPAVWRADSPGHNYELHQWHSAEFRFTNPDQENYWNALLNQFRLLPSQ